LAALVSAPGRPNLGGEAKQRHYLGAEARRPAAIIVAVCVWTRVIVPFGRFW